MRIKTLTSYCVVEGPAEIYLLALEALKGKKGILNCINCL